jgi:hypothetical protein
MQLKRTLYCHIKPALFYLICFGPYYFRKALLLTLITMRTIIHSNNNDRINTWLMILFFVYIDDILKSDILYVIYPVLYSQSQNANEGLIVGLLSFVSPFALILVPYYHFSEPVEYLDINYEVNKFVETSLIRGMGFINDNNIDD